MIAPVVAAFLAATTYASYGFYTYSYYFPPAPATTPWAPSWSPDGKRITVGMQGSLWNVDARSGAATEIVYDSRYNSSPAWSPDGKWIVYTSDDSGKNIQLGILSVTTGETRLLTDDGNIYLEPVFSPDGSRLAYVSNQPKGHFHIYVRAIREGQWAGEPVMLTEENRRPGDRLYVGGWDMHTQPTWTPDGSQIVFVANRGEPLGSGSLWRMPAEANGIRKATRILEEQTLFRTRPHVSPDGKRIVYSSTAGAADQFNHLYVIPTVGGAPYKLTFGSNDHFHPRWSPDGEWIAFISNELGLPQLAVLETYGGERRIIRISRRSWKRPMGRISARIVDDATGRLVPARVQGLAADGKFYAPVDAFSRITASGDHFFHARGQFEAEVPPGEMTVEASRGPEYWPSTAKVRIRAGEVTGVELRLKRLGNPALAGWYSGSTHVHMNYGGNLGNTPKNLVAMADAEGLRMVMEQIANKDNRVLDVQYFVPGGGEHPASKGHPEVKLHVGEEYRPPFWGHVFFLGLKDHLISPFLTGYEGTGVESLYPSNTDMFRKARAQGAVTSYVHPFAGDRDPLESGLGYAKALPVDAALGTIDCLEWSYCGQAQVRLWHHFLNNDIALAPVGGEDSITSLHRSRTIGSFRTYAFVAAPVTVEKWLDALRKGYTYFTTGPLVEFRVNGKLPGEAIHLAAEGGPVTLEGRVISIAPLSKVLIYSNGQVLKEIPLSPDGKSARFSQRIQAKESAWYSVYAEGPTARYLDAEHPEALTNAVRVYVGDQKIRSRESAEYFMRWIDKLKTTAGGWPWWRSDAEKQHVFGQLDQAREVYVKLANEAGNR